ncbi:MAG: FkbM family methyltransferase [Magnetococcales bacterium]|nr:FkbM family methyltransferase [Magnetococcales bacterium]MBF0115987.1 FkbM family methyltransferase [Magnetococcales bacterium]
MKKLPLRHVAFVLAATNHGSMLVNRHDYRLVGESGYGVGYQLLNNGAFDHQEIEVALQLLETRQTLYGPGVVAVDCGANVGAHTLEWARFMNDWGEVVAIEAQERIFYALAGNLAMNNCFNARAIWAAVGAHGGTIGVPIPNYSMPSSFGSLELRPSDHTEFIGQPVSYAPETLQRTQMIALDDWQLARLDLLKIDIEGMELEALAGAKQTIARCLPYLMIEKMKTDEAEMLSFLQPLGYLIFPLGKNILAIHEGDPAAKQLQDDTLES